MHPIVIIALFYLILAGLGAAAACAQEKRTRIISALACLGWSSFMLLLAGAAQRLNYNAWYSGAAYRMLEAYIAGIEGGRQDSVLHEMKRMTNELQATYEHRGNFKELAERAADSLSKTNVNPVSTPEHVQPFQGASNRAPVPEALPITPSPK